MTFLNGAMLFGLVLLAVPILLHLLSRSRARIVDWGAMRFLRDSLTSRYRRIRLEEALLLALRCLLCALLVLALARPYLVTRPSPSWLIVLPAAVVGTVCLGVGVAIGTGSRWRGWLFGLAAGLWLVAALASLLEDWLQKRRWLPGQGGRDVAIVIDGSRSMTLGAQGQTQFDRALADARLVLATGRTGDAFCLVLAGPVPRAIVAPPVYRSEPVATALAELRPVGGTMNVPETLNLASAVLAEGHNTSKTIVLISDGQRQGWDVESPTRWEFLAEALRARPVRPRIVCRQLELPPGPRRNLAVAEITWSRRVVGTDRPVGLEVRVLNAGDVPVRPAGLEVEVDGEPVATARFARELPPRAVEVTHLEHRFTRPGVHTVLARVLVEDELPADNALVRALRVVDRLPVLIVEGRPSRHPLGGAGAFVEVALVPGDEADDGPSAGALPRSSPAADAGQPARDSLVATELVAASDVATVTDWSAYAVVILANVPMLPEAVAGALVERVRSGAGLLVVTGDRVRPDFYNNWQARNSGDPVLPARLLERRLAAETPLRLDGRSLSHPAVRVLEDADQSDVGAALIRAYWRLGLDPGDPQVRVGPRLQNGEPCLVDRRLGQGLVAMTAFSLDAQDSSLPTLKSFVPLVHELVYYLAAPLAPGLNLEPGQEACLELRESTAVSPTPGTGLLGEYFSDKDLTGERRTRLDPVVSFDWGRGQSHAEVDADTFSVRWTGWLQPPATERYTFLVTGDDGIRLWVNGRLLVNEWHDAYPTEYQAAMDLSREQRYRVRLEYYENLGEAVAKFAWSSPSRPTEVVPASCLYPACVPASPATEAAGTGGVDTVQVLSPSGRTLPVKVQATESGLAVRGSETFETGLYAVELPPELAANYQELGADRTTVPFVVSDRAEEGILDPLTAADIGVLTRNAELLIVSRSDELAAAVTGTLPGTEVWPFLAVGALVLVVAEVLLTGWIARGRRLATVEVVGSSRPGFDVQAFRAHASKLMTEPAGQQG